MPDSNVAVTPGVGANIDTRTAPDGDHRQVMVLGDGTGAQTAVVSVNGGMAIRGTPLPNVTGTLAAGATGVLVGPIDITEAANCTIWLSNNPAATAFTGSPTVVFEQSVDNVSWSPLGVMRQDTGGYGASFVLAANTANASIPFTAALPGVAFIRVRLTVGTSTGAITATVDPGTMPFQPLVNVVPMPRANVAFFTSAPVAATATETLLALTGYRAGAAVAATTTPAVITAGRTLRLQQLDLAYVAIATAAYGFVKLRVSTSGLASLTSPVVRQFVVGAATPGAANSTGMVQVDMGDGIDIPAGASFVLSLQGVTGLTASAAGYVHADFHGYEF